MCVGTIIIANDLLGIVVSESNGKLGVKDKFGVVHNVRRDACHEVINPYALSYLFVNKLKQRIKHE